MFSYRVTHRKWAHLFPLLATGHNCGIASIAHQKVMPSILSYGIWVTIAWIYRLIWLDVRKLIIKIIKMIKFIAIINFVKRFAAETISYYDKLRPLFLGHQLVRSRHVFDVSAAHKRRSTSSSAKITKIKEYICLKHFFLRLSTMDVKCFDYNRSVRNSRYRFFWTLVLVLVVRKCDDFCKKGWRFL